ncbi:MAG: hypothetical protein JRM85_03030 [Nitrososphaerota archaeon]|nr:hypothetical protein [Nitrososphaerota archaeon]MDG6919289.1 hypothetical protein [Nitrososphaerota archaeon]
MRNAARRKRAVSEIVAALLLLAITVGSPAEGWPPGRRTRASCRAPPTRLPLLSAVVCMSEPKPEVSLTHFLAEGSGRIGGLQPGPAQRTPA